MGTAGPVTRVPWGQPVAIPATMDHLMTMTTTMTMTMATTSLEKWISNCTISVENNRIHIRSEQVIDLNVQSWYNGFVHRRTMTE
jgi:hypothetical protein